MRTLFCIILLCVSTVLYGYNTQRIMAELQSHFDLIEYFYADIVLETSGTGKVRKQTGNIVFKEGDGTIFRLDGATPMEVQIKENGDMYFNGIKQATTDKPGQTHQLGDIYFIELLRGFDIEVEREDDNYVYLTDYDKSSRIERKRLLNANYNKSLKVIDRVRYIGQEYDYPYDIRIKYKSYDGIPIVESLSTIVSAFSVTLNSTMRFDNIQIDRK